MSTYVDGGWYNHNSRASMTVNEDQRSAKVTYRGESGEKYSVIVRQKPNPIGFTARLPGDVKRGS